MALFTFRCPTCKVLVKRILTPLKAKEPLFCKADNTQLVREFQEVSSIVKEVIDNGLQTRKVEQFANAPELLQEREEAVRELKKKNDL